MVSVTAIDGAPAPDQVGAAAKSGCNVAPEHAHELHRHRDRTREPAESGAKGHVHIDLAG
jgi:hypothetical protein